MIGFDPNVLIRYMLQNDPFSQRRPQQSWKSTFSEETLVFVGVVVTVGETRSLRGDGSHSRRKPAVSATHS
jgi:predicted nucleic-acid-binding protein